jgi:hypothetical protein
MVEQLARSHECLGAGLPVDPDDAAVVVGAHVEVADEERTGGVESNPLGGDEDVLVAVPGDVDLVSGERVHPHQPGAA